MFFWLFWCLGVVLGWAGLVGVVFWNVVGLGIIVKCVFCGSSFLRGEALVQTTVATLLLITSAVVLSCVVVSYAVSIVEATLQTSNIPQLQRIKDLQRSLINETDSLFNSTLPVPAQSPFPVP